MRLFITALILSLSILASCQNQNRDDENSAQSELWKLPRTQNKEDINAYNELMSFYEAKDKFNAKDYKGAFKIFIRILNRYSPSTFESESLYMLGQIIPIILIEEPSFIEESYKELYSEKEASNAEGAEDQFSIENVHSFLGINKSNGEYKYNGAPLRRIINDESVTMIPKDMAYYISVSNRFSKIEKQEDKEKFKANVRTMNAFSDNYRTSEIQKTILDNADYFPNRLPFTLDAKERKDYDDMRKKVSERIDVIKEDVIEKAYVNATRVRMRDRTFTKPNEEDKTILYLNNYDFVDILRRFTVKQPGKKDPENWVVVRYATPYGSIVGLSYERYFSPVSELDENIYAVFKNAIDLYSEHKYLESAALFAAVLNSNEINYYTDKACYYLWKVNNNIGECVTSKDTDFYQYVKKYPKYFIYDENMNAFRSSMLLYSYLVKTVPTSPYKYLISSKSDE